MRDAVIVSSVRTAVGKAPKGTLAFTRPDDLAAIAIKGALEKVPALDAKEIEDVVMGCAMPEAEQGTNVARIASLRAGLPVIIVTSALDPMSETRSMEEGAFAYLTKPFNDKVLIGHVRAALGQVEDRT